MYQNLQCLAELFQVGPEGLADLRVLQGQLHLSLYHFELVAHVVVFAGKLHGRHAAVIAGVLGHGVGQLDLTAGTGFGVGQQVVDLRGEQHAAQDGVVFKLQ